MSCLVRATATTGLFIAIAGLFTTTAATTGLVYMAVGQLFFGRSTDILDRHIEIQMLTGKRMVTVNSHVIVLHLDHSDGYRPLVGAGLKLHADLYILDALKTLFRHDLLKSGICLAVAFLGADADLHLVTRGFPAEGSLKAGNDIVVAVQIGERLAWLGLIDHRALVSAQGIIH